VLPKGNKRYELHVLGVVLIIMTNVGIMVLVE